MYFYVLYLNCRRLGDEAESGEQRAYKYLDADANQDDTAENSSLACYLVAEGLADINAAEAETEGDGTDDDDRDQCFDEAMVGNGKAYRKGIYRGRYSLKDDSLGGKLCAGAFLAFVMPALVDHFTAYEGKQAESYPGDKHREAVEHFDYGMYAYPADKRHKTLANAEGARYFDAFFLAHAGLCKSVCQGYGKGVRRKTDS